MTPTPTPCPQRPVVMAMAKAEQVAEPAEADYLDVELSTKIRGLFRSG